MECRVCGRDIPEESRFCQYCGSEVLTVEETEVVLEEALVEGEEVFKEELRTAGIDVTDESDLMGVEQKRLSAIDRLKSAGSVVRKSAESTVEFGRRVTDSTSDALRRTKEFSADTKEKFDNAVERGKEITCDTKDKIDNAVEKGKAIHEDTKQKFGVAVDKGKEIGQDVSAIAKKAGEGAETAVKRTRKSMEELGQVGVIITQRALDVVRASLRAVEIVDEYLVKKDSNYEIGTFITGVAIPPYLEIEFHKRTPGLTEREKDLVEALRAASIEPYALLDHLKKAPADKEDPDLKVD